MRLLPAYKQPPPKASAGQRQGDHQVRVDFGTRENQKRFFRSVKGTGTWKGIYKKVSKTMCDPPTFKVFEAWVYGRYLPPYEVVKAIHRLIGGSKDLAELNIKLVSDNWGSVKGGKSKIKAYGTNLTKVDRVKGGRNAPKDPKRLRSISHLGFLERAKRKFLGPNRELLFNKLEKEVAETLHANGINYEYEPIIQLEGRFVIPDFLLEGKVAIECTEWTNVKEKSSQLKNKIKKLLASKVIKRAIVVTNQGLFQGYQKNLNKLTTVITIEQLIQALKVRG